VRTFLVGAAVLVAITAIGSAAATTVTVSITKNGYVPKSVTVAKGDTVQFTNGDTAAHQVAFKSTTGVTCSPASIVLQPSQSGSCTFATPGSYSYSDPNFKGNTYRGTITVTGTTAPDTLSATASPLIVVHGGHVTIAGKLSSLQAGQNVDVLEQQCGSSAQGKAATVATGTGGAYSASVAPVVNTTYAARSKLTTSPNVVVKVRPRVRLAKVAAHKYSIRVTAANKLVGKYAGFQRFNAATGRWVSVKVVSLRTASGTAPAVTTSVTFRSTVKPLLRVRAVLSQAQVGSCYLPGTSNTIRS
jgi:plastocyanin